MTFVEKHRLIGGKTKQELLKISWGGARSRYRHVRGACREVPRDRRQLYMELGMHTQVSGLKAFADDLMVHEPAMRDWLKSELDGSSDGAEKSSPISNATRSAGKTR